MLHVNDDLSIPLKEFHFSFSRSPGPGGQNVNKVNTKVTLRWDVVNSPSLTDEVRRRLMETNRRRINKEGVLILTSHRFRDQGRNVADALSKLSELIRLASQVPKPRKPTRPSRAAHRRRMESKRRTADKKRLRRPVQRDD